MIRHKLAITIGLIIVLTLGGAGAGYAFWTTPASVSGTVVAKTISVSETMPLSLGGTLTGTAPVTGAITVTNTGSVAGTYSAAVATTSTSGTTALAQAVNVVAWPTASPTGCSNTTPSGTITSGTWANFPPVTGSLAPTSSASYCLRASLATTSGLSSDSITPTITATLTAGSSWSTAARVSATQTYTAPPPTAGWYQLRNVATQRCANVTSTTAGANVVSASCSSPAVLNGNAFRLTASGTTSIATYIAQTLGIASLSNGNAKPAITASTTGDSSSSWTVSQSGTNYIFSNVGNLRCLADDSTSVGAALTVDNCAPSTTQQFILEPIK